MGVSLTNPWKEKCGGTLIVHNTWCGMPMEGGIRPYTQHPFQLNTCAWGGEQNFCVVVEVR